jgi:hypothetical protein
MSFIPRTDWMLRCAHDFGNVLSLVGARHVGIDDGSKFLGDMLAAQGDGLDAILEHRRRRFRRFPAG